MMLRRGKMFDHGFIKPTRPFLRYRIAKGILVTDADTWLVLLACSPSRDWLKVVNKQILRREIKMLYFLEKLDQIVVQRRFGVVH